MNLNDFPLAQLLWWVFASLAVGGALGTITRKNPIASLLFLVLTFFSLAAIYTMLGAYFIGAIQVIVYAGAIMVLFLFTIMLLNLGHDYRSDLRGGLWIVTSFVAAGLVGWAIWRALLGPGAVMQLDGEQRIAASVGELNAVGAIAQPLYRDFLVAFELTSLLLLVAIIGAVLLAKRRV
ncbi:MAG TPA: NADH-quinone oxidoreductase subunit J [Longimicrobiales bacterium]|nr:NADH-quinone oxidoreductase subunit J [Longimicrobiales bacterium]